jgi:hypothetical protein
LFDAKKTSDRGEVAEDLGCADADVDFSGD